MNFNQHTSQRFNEELEDIRSHVLEMGSMVERQLTMALQALLGDDLDKAEQVFTSELKVNAIEVDIDEQCTKILALRHPIAGDLRLVTTVLKSIADLERIGDEANKIAKMAIKVNGQGNKPAYYADLNRMSGQVKTMLHDTLDAFVRLDAEWALTIAESDRQINREYDNLTRLLVTHMQEDPRAIKHMLSITWCARSLERIGDHCKNICEYVIYLVGGKDIRHTRLDQVRDEMMGGKDDS